MKRRRLNEAQIVPGVDPRLDEFRERASNFDLRYAHFERNLEIDKHKLDEALCEHPGQLAKVCEIVAEVISFRDGLKDLVKLKESGASINVRKRAEENDEKTTEGGISAKVSLDPERRKAVKQYLWAVQEAARWEGLKEAMKERGYVLRELGELWRTGYFADKSVQSSGGAQDQGYDRRRSLMAEARRKRMKERE